MRVVRIAVPNLAAGYAAMVADEAREQEAEAWTEGLIADSAVSVRFAASLDCDSNLTGSFRAMRTSSTAIAFGP